MSSDDDEMNESQDDSSFDNDVNNNNNDEQQQQQQQQDDDDNDLISLNDQQQQEQQENNHGVIQRRKTTTTTTIPKKEKQQRHNNTRKKPMDDHNNNDEQMNDNHHSRHKLKKNRQQTTTGTTTTTTEKNNHHQQSSITRSKKEKSNNRKEKQQKQQQQEQAGRGRDDDQQRTVPPPLPLPPPPPPPPPPPVTLIKLIQKDQKVLQYFQSLQENLQADVTIWKSRAKLYETKYQELLLLQKKYNKNKNHTDEKVLQQQGTTKQQQQQQFPNGIDESGNPHELIEGTSSYQEQQQEQQQQQQQHQEQRNSKNKKGMNDDDDNNNNHIITNDTISNVPNNKNQMINQQQQKQKQQQQISQIDDTLFDLAMDEVSSSSSNSSSTSSIRKRKNHNENLHPIIEQQQQQQQQTNSKSKQEEESPCPIHDDQSEFHLDATDSTNSDDDDTIPSSDHHHPFESTGVGRRKNHNKSFLPTTTTNSTKRKRQQKVVLNHHNHNTRTTTTTTTIGSNNKNRNNNIFMMKQSKIMTKDDNNDIIESSTDSSSRCSDDDNNNRRTSEWTGTTTTTTTTTGLVTGKQKQKQQSKNSVLYDVDQCQYIFRILYQGYEMLETMGISLVAINDEIKVVTPVPVVVVNKTIHHEEEEEEETTSKPKQAKLKSSSTEDNQTTTTTHVEQNNNNNNNDTNTDTKKAIDQEAIGIETEMDDTDADADADAENEVMKHNKNEMNNNKIIPKQQKCNNKKTTVSRLSDETVVTAIITTIHEVSRYQINEPIPMKSYPPLFSHRMILKKKKKKKKKKTSVVVLSNNNKNKNKNKNTSHYEEENDERNNDLLPLPQEYNDHDDDDDDDGINNNNIHEMHPAIECQKKILHILMIFETFCCSTITKEDWDTFFEIGSACSSYQSSHSADNNNNNGNSNSNNNNNVSMKDESTDSWKFKLQSMKIGLYGRRNLTENFIKSLESEITEAWACTDRTTRISTDSVRYYNNNTTTTNTTTTEESNDDNDCDNNNNNNAHPTTTTLPPLQGDDDASAVQLILGAKSKTRLASLIEHCMLCQILIGMFLSRDDRKAAVRTILNYMISTLPVMSIEDYPGLPPVLSFVTLEAMLCPDPTMLGFLQEGCNDSKCSGDPFEKRHFNWLYTYVESNTTNDIERQTLASIFEGIIQNTASIWYQRFQSTNDKIRSVASVELVSLDRLLKMEIIPLFNSANVRQMENHHKSLFSKTSELLDTFTQKNGDVNKFSDLNHLVSQLLLLLSSDTDQIQQKVEDSLWISTDEFNESRIEADTLFDLCKCSSLVIRQFVLRQLDSCRIQIHTRTINRQQLDVSQYMKSWTLSTTMSQKFRELSLDQKVHTFRSILEYATNLADAGTIVKCIQLLLQDTAKTSSSSAPSNVTSLSLFDILQDIKFTPVVRVINLMRRKDRYVVFLAQACRENITVLKAVAPYLESTENSDRSLRNEVLDYGFHAHDGTVGSLLESRNHLVKEIGSVSLLNKLVNPHWRPHDLKPFDRNAPTDEHLVRMTSSEVACSLSHICSWKGVVRSLQNVDNGYEYQAVEGPYTHLYLGRLVRLFKISGFAEGPPLVDSGNNQKLPPAPVCVIMEDDAILCDRFTDRLASLLKELPRDFHFCSLGYSRPKTAPIVPYSTELGIPSMLWYLTGYCLSLAGAQYLLNSLPVVGPVDTFVGLNMVKNWDNSYGVALGVGNYAKPVGVIPSRNQLGKLLQFRVFCALHPLCTQKYTTTQSETMDSTVSDNHHPSNNNKKRNHQSVSSNARAWRLRDTDIEYSGDGAPVKL